MRRRTTLIAAAALAAAASTGARAQIITLSPAELAKDAVTAVNTGQDVVNTGRMVAGTIHGNGFGITTLVPLLGGALASNPLGNDAGAATSLMSGVGTGGGMGGLFNGFLGNTQTFQPTGGDPEAQMLTQRARAAAGQLAVGQQFMNSGTTRLSLLPGLLGAIGGTADVKDAVDANTRVAGEQMTEGAQSSQLQALQIYQQAEANAQASRRDLAWRQSAENMTRQSQAAADAAGGGQVSLVNN